MEFHPVRYVKTHPVGTVACIAVGWYLGSRYGTGGLGIPGFSLRARASAGTDGDE